MFPTFTTSPDTVGLIVLGGVRILFYIGFFLYIIFAFIALRQIEIMRKTVITPFSSAVFLIGVAHLLAAIGMFIFAFFTLM